MSEASVLRMRPAGLSGPISRSQPCWNSFWQRPPSKQKLAERPNSNMILPAFGLRASMLTTAPRMPMVPDSVLISTAFGALEILPPTKRSTPLATVAVILPVPVEGSNT